MFTWQKQYKTHVPSTTSWQREGDSLLKTQRREHTQQVILCHIKTGTLLLPVRSSTWVHLSPVDTTQMAQLFLARCLQPACGFSSEGWAVGRELCTLPLHENSCSLKHKYFFTPSGFQLMCRWKPRRWSVGENPCLAQDGLLLL